MVNGVRGEFFDEYANDQDRGLFYYTLTDFAFGRQPLFGYY